MNPEVSAHLAWGRKFHTTLLHEILRHDFRSYERIKNDLKSENTAPKRQVRDLTEQLAVEKQKNEVPKKRAIKK